MSKLTIEYWKERVKVLKFYNDMAPFPVIGTEYIKDIKKHINRMKKDSDIDYDSLPVAACKYCKSLRLEVDEVGNDYCMTCGSINEVIIFDTIHEYLKTKNQQLEDEYN